VETAKSGPRRIDTRGRILKDAPKSQEALEAAVGPAGPLTPFMSASGGWGYADSGGKTVIPPIFDAAFPFYEGKAVVVRGKLWWYIELPELKSYR
jgi:hypothetical protein